MTPQAKNSPPKPEIIREEHWQRPLTATHKTSNSEGRVAFRG
jgi:hypothetical protein